MHIDQAEPWVLTAEELDRLVDELPERYRALALVSAYGSLRWEELIALRVPNLDLIRNRVRIEETLVESGRLMAGHGKTKRSRRWVTLPEEVTFALAEHLRIFPPKEKRVGVHRGEGISDPPSCVRSVGVACLRCSSRSVSAMPVRG
jgi:integrase